MLMLYNAPGAVDVDAALGCVRASRIICLQSERKRMATAYCSRPTKFCHYKWLCVVLMMVLLDMELHFLNLLPYKSGQAVGLASIRTGVCQCSPANQAIEGVEALSSALLREDLKPDVVCLTLDELKIEHNPLEVNILHKTNPDATHGCRQAS
nr:hypothetical protein [Tanacetum cinerariifolium]